MILGSRSVPEQGQEIGNRKRQNEVHDQGHSCVREEAWLLEALENCRTTRPNHPLKRPEAGCFHRSFLTIKQVLLLCILHTSDPYLPGRRCWQCMTRLPLPCNCAPEPSSIRRGPGERSHSDQKHLLYWNSFFSSRV